jgi:iron complex outermembrane recepter protein
MKKILLLAYLILLAICVFAQTPAKTGKITGLVTDTSRKAVESASVSLLRAKDSSLVKLSVTQKSGRFGFENIADGKYLLMVTAIGNAKNYSKPFEITPASNAIEIPAILLRPQSKDLKAVTITATRPLVEHKIDRTIVNVEAAITNAGANALEILEKSPGIQVDKDGNISLKGKDGVMVLIDGRPTNLSASDLANMLRNTQASQLDQIEIMTNPPARFDASGNAGVINIKTKKNRQFGYNGSVTLGYSQGYYARFNDGLNFNYRKNKVNLFTNLSHGYNHTRSGLNIQRSFRKSDTKELVSNFDQEGLRYNEGSNYNVKAGVDYFVNKKTTLGVVLNGAYSPRSSLIDNVTDISDPHGILLSQTKAINNNDQKWKNFSGNFNYRHVYDSTGRELTADVDYVYYDSKNNQLLANSYFNASGTATDRPDSLLAYLPQRINIYTARIDYLKPLKKGGRLEMGVKSSFVETDNDATYDSIINAQLVHDYRRSNHFIYKENVNAAYVSINKPINKKWGAQVGLRLENTNAKGNQVTTKVKFDRHYTQLFPTGYLQFLPSKNHTLVLNYGRRIRRPDYQSLNPFINFIDRYTYQQGNPDLKPQFSHNVELSHTFKNFLTTTINYSRTTDIIQRVIEQDEAKNETYVRDANIAKQRQYGLAVSINNSITKWWKNSFYVNVYSNKFDGIVDSAYVSITANTLSLNGSQQFQFAKTWSAEISGFFRTGGIEGVIYGKSLGMMSIGLGKQIMKGQGTVRLNVRDVFYTQRFRGESKYGNVDAKFQDRPDSRVLSVNFSYRFSKGKMNNNTPKRRSGSSTDEQSRIQG